MTKSGGASVAQVADALLWLANSASAQGCGLRAGAFVITGSRVGPLAIPHAATVSVTLA